MKNQNILTTAVFMVILSALTACGNTTDTHETDFFTAIPTAEIATPDMSPITQAPQTMTFVETSPVETETVLAKKSEIEQSSEKITPANTLEQSIVERVIDGDTIVLTCGERVRFIGINAPEIGEPGADEATQFVRDMVEGKTVWLESDGNDRDIYDRLRRYVWVVQPVNSHDEDEIRASMLNAMLLERGLANIMFIGDVRYAELFRILERNDND